MQQNQETLLVVSNLTKKYHNLTAVNNLSFEVKRGEIFGFLGPNGAGKTTSINMIAGLLKPDQGEIRLKNFSILKNKFQVQQLIGLCPQNIILWESLTCLEQLEFMGEMYDLKRKIAHAHGLELLRALGLLEKKNCLAKNLSGGMQRRLNIALALIHSPELVILDEPQAGLDPQSRILVRDYIRTLARTTTIILTTHEMDEAERLSDRVAIIDHGELLVVDTPNHLTNSLKNTNLLEINIPETQTELINHLLATLPLELSSNYRDGILSISTSDVLESLPMVTEILKKFKIQTDSLKIRKCTLEDVFISLTGRGLRS